MYDAFGVHSAEGLGDVHGDAEREVDGDGFVAFCNDLLEVAIGHKREDDGVVRRRADHGNGADDCRGQARAEEEVYLLLEFVEAVRAGQNELFDDDILGRECARVAHVLIAAVELD